MSSDDTYTASAERVFGDAVVSVSVYPGVPHARVDLVDGTRALIDVEGREVGRRRPAPPAQDLAEVVTPPGPDANESPAHARLSVFYGPRGWVAHANFASRKAWSYANGLDEIRAAAMSALAKVGSRLDPDEPIVFDAPATFMKLWPQIREQEDYVEQLRRELKDEEQRISELRKTSLRSLRRAHVPIEDALQLLDRGPVLDEGRTASEPD
ncbi:hypothetical protein [Herbiconiux sp. YIM B11900]|uniref:hypothetical protein n=1 Tax=Herbiconiux sp. YIM B11900 TaxID=3404131 RepID=UPI003F83F49C